jgi:hypothetical protein
MAVLVSPPWDELWDGVFGWCCGLSLAIKRARAPTRTRRELTGRLERPFPDPKSHPEKGQLRQSTKRRNELDGILQRLLVRLRGGFRVETDPRTDPRCDSPSG